jgi:hypothetical protein
MEHLEKGGADDEICQEKDNQVAEKGNKGCQENDEESRVQKVGPKMKKAMRQRRLAFFGWNGGFAPQGATDR